MIWEETKHFLKIGKVTLGFLNPYNYGRLNILQGSDTAEKTYAISRFLA
jgi:hypothetical protein